MWYIVFRVEGIHRANWPQGNHVVPKEGTCEFPEDCGENRGAVFFDVRTVQFVFYIVTTKAFTTELQTLPQSPGLSIWAFGLPVSSLNSDSLFVFHFPSKFVLRCSHKS